jgi:SagB-type dehydrogenase family enzyme
LTGARWIADDLAQKRRFRVSPTASAALIFCVSSQPRSSVVSFVCHRLPDAEAEEVVDRLVEQRLLLDATAAERDPRLAWFRSIQSSWERANWRLAADYHLATWDYPCLDYSTQDGGFTADRALMREFNAVAPDLARYKVSTNVARRLSLPAQDPDLAPIPVAEVWQRQAERSWHTDGLTFEQLAVVLSLTFGIKSELQVRPPAAPHIRRTSPSGGSRHPTEAYVVAVNVDGLSSGWYHVCMKGEDDRPSLDLLIDGGVGAEDLRRIFASSFRRAPFDVRAIVVLTSVFERNMYRYREPRTFRTVHMDAGHLAATATILANALSRRTSIEYSDLGVEERLGLSPLEEGYLLTILIG